MSPTDNGEGRFSVTKHLEGRELQAGEFSFELVENATGKVVAEGVNDAEGNVELGKIKFTEPGTRTFTLRERKGDKGGVTYSTVEYAVTAQAGDNHMGALEVTFTVHDAAGKEAKDLIFTNTYKADPTSLQINAVKVLTGEGAKLGSGQFEFVIENADSKRTEITKAHNGEAVNNAAPVEFQSIPLDKAGDYHLAMREVKGKDAQIVYDDSVVDITFTVVDDQNGKLVVKDNAVKYAVDGKPVGSRCSATSSMRSLTGSRLVPAISMPWTSNPLRSMSPRRSRRTRTSLSKPETTPVLALLWLRLLA